MISAIAADPGVDALAAALGLSTRALVAYVATLVASAPRVASLHRHS